MKTAIDSDEHISMKLNAPKLNGNSILINVNKQLKLL